MLNRATVIVAFCITVVVRAYFFDTVTIPWYIGLIFLLLVRDTAKVTVEQVGEFSPEEQARIDALAESIIREAEKEMEDEDGR